MTTTTPALDELPAGTESCPFTYSDGTVCGDPLMLWEKVEQSRHLYWEDGRGWIAGPSSMGDASGADDEVCCTNLHYFAVPDIEDYQ